MAKRAKQMPDVELSDRERILLTIIRQLSSTQLMTGGRRFGDGAFGDYVHFDRWTEPKAGDLVLAGSGGIHRWTVGYYVEPLPGSYGGAVIREIGTGALCNYSNESFAPIRNLSYTDLLEGAERLFYKKVLKAFAVGAEWLYCYGGIKFDGDKVTIGIRERHGGFGQPSTPFDCVMQWTPKTTIKAILAALRHAGYGTRSFREAASEQETTHG